MQLIRCNGLRDHAPLMIRLHNDFPMSNRRKYGTSWPHSCSGHMTGRTSCSNLAPGSKTRTGSPFIKRLKKRLMRMLTGEHLCGGRSRGGQAVLQHATVQGRSQGEAGQRHRQETGVAKAEARPPQADAHSVVRGRRLGPRNEPHIHGQTDTTAWTRSEDKYLKTSSGRRGEAGNLPKSTNSLC